MTTQEIRDKRVYREKSLVIFEEICRMQGQVNDKSSLTLYHFLNEVFKTHEIVKYNLDCCIVRFNLSNCREYYTERYNEFVKSL